ncbi:MAG: FAD-dependent oxidoreductase [Pseudomonadota bacterium]
MTQHHYDVIIVGGGINGVGIAQACAAQRQSCLLLEKSALASGTSSKSSKLIHGGLRYLESYEFSMVRESLRERELLLRNAPDLVKLRDFHIPIYAATRRQPFLVRSGLSLYALLGGLKADNRFRSIPPRNWDNLDGLRTTHLRKVYCYKDGQTNDAALTMAVMQSAIDLGAELAMPAELVSATVTKQGVSVSFLRDGDETTVQGRVLVNAAGPWVNKVAQKISPNPASMEVSLVQGSHMVVKGKTQHGIYYMESRRDGRAVFVMPWGEHTMIGTTEVKFNGEPDEVTALNSEISYLSAILMHHFPKYQGRLPTDIIESWAGLRVLPGGGGHAFHKSRETIFLADTPAKPHVLSVYGGKLTSYRATAEKVFRRIAPSLDLRKPIANTKELPLNPVD